MSELSLPVAITTPPTAQSDSASGILADPLSYGETFNSFLEQFVRVRIPTPASLSTQIAAIAQPVGSSLFLTGVDLTANTSEYVYTHPSTGLTYLYANGATVSQTTYADLFAWFGGHIWAADPGSGNFVLPDTRGRSLWTTGTNSATDVGDNDGVTESSRQPKHTHSDSLAGDSHTHGSGGLSVSGAPSITDPGHTHTHNALYSPGGGSVNPGFGFGPPHGAATIDSATTGITSGLGTLDVGGSTDGGTVNISGSVGSGMSGSDAVAHIVIGSLVIRF